MERAFSPGVESAGLLNSGLDLDSADHASNKLLDNSLPDAVPGWRAYAHEMRAAFRLARTGLHLLWGMTTVALTFRFLPIKLQRALKTRWSRQLLDALGVELRVAGTPPQQGMVVANHISWLDVYAINATAPTAFVSKNDVRGWPLIGWLSSRSETLFIERGSRSAAMRIKDHVTDRLRQGGCVALFPEGTTSTGVAVLPFHSALFQSAIEAAVVIAPVAVRYSDRDGKRSTAPVYIGDTSLWQSLCVIARADRLTAHLSFLPTIAAEGKERRQITELARQNIAGSLG